MSVSSQDDFRASFFEECEELLEAMQDGFDQLADDLHDTETMHAIFRAVHSIKGGAGAFGLNELVAFAHQFETALDKVRSGSIDANGDLVELFRQCGDHLSDVVAAARDGGDIESDATDRLQEKLTEAIGENLEETEADLPDFVPVTLDFGLEPDLDDATDIEFSVRVDKELYANGNEIFLLLRSLESFGPVNTSADAASVPNLTDLDPNASFLAWNVSIDGDVSEKEVEEAFEFVSDVCSLNFSGSDEKNDEIPLLVPSMDGSGDVDNISLQVGISEGDAPEASKSPQVSPPKKSAPKPGGTIRVDFEKVDKLINLVGELVIKEAMLSQSIADFDPPSESDVSVGLESLKQLAGEIQEGVMAIRAQPVKPMFQRMSRIVREASAATGKRVKFETLGEYTEVDKTVIERLVDPLTHMIRNAIDHGLETQEEREKAGKDPQGSVTLAAAHRSGRVMIDISDDGGGVNRAKVRSIAIEKGLIDESAELGPTEIDNLLFLPGFSSKEEVSELSGRGVGLDVARSEIQGLGGRVLIHSEPGKGTTFSISLPLTLAVLEGMVVKVDDQTMVIPISTIQETLRPDVSDIHEIGSGGKILRSRSNVVPIVDLGKFFGFRRVAQEDEKGVFLLMESEAKHKYAFIVDEIQDQRQVVIKSLETNYQRVDGVSAATILGDGRIALIIDPETIIKNSGSGVSNFNVHSAGE